MKGLKLIRRMDKSFRVRPKRKQDRKAAKALEAYLAQPEVSRAIAGALGEMWADQVVFGAHQKPSEYLKKRLPPVPDTTGA